MSNPSRHLFSLGVGCFWTCAIQFGEYVNDQVIRFQETWRVETPRFLLNDQQVSRTDFCFNSFSNNGRFVGRDIGLDKSKDWPKGKIT